MIGVCLTIRGDNCFWCHSNITNGGNIDILGGDSDSVSSWQGGDSDSESSWQGGNSDSESSWQGGDSDSESSWQGGNSDKQIFTSSEFLESARGSLGFTLNLEA